MSLPIIQASRCRSCSQPIFWLKNDSTGKRAPIDVATYPDGNVQIDLVAGIWWVVAQADLAAQPATTLHKNHFATCKDAPLWKK